MANEISYEIIDIDGYHMRVKYTLGEHTITLAMSPEGDVHEYIKQVAPRTQLLRMREPKLDTTLVGKTGTVDLTETPTSTPV